MQGSLLRARIQPLPEGHRTIPWERSGRATWGMTFRRTRVPGREQLGRWYGASLGKVSSGPG
eukprot:13016647-Alexandrium_andersonii.AAC.1